VRKQVPDEWFEDVGVDEVSKKGTVTVGLRLRFPLRRLVRKWEKRCQSA
jgi:hypothetical protein